MRAQSHAKTRKGLAIVTAGMFALSSMSIAPVAFAQDTPAAADAQAGDVNANLVSQLSKDTKAKLTIHKIKGGFSGIDGQWGTEQQIPGDPLEGVAFDVYKIADIDLTSVEGWKKYSELDPASANTYATEANYVKTLKTDSNGVASETFPLGVYVVKENLAKSDVEGTLTPAAPFITALPFTTKDGSGWNKDVHVYPKNQELTSEKTVKDEGKHAQGTVSYDLAGTIPPVPANHEGKYFDGYSLVDIYDPKKWTPKTDSIKVQVTADGEKALDLGAGDFQVSEPKAYAKEAGKNAFTISLTRAGLDKVEAQAKSGKQIRLVATVEGDLAKDLVPGELENKMSVIPPNTSTPDWKRSEKPDDPDNPPEDPTPETEVKSKYGKINITKVDSKESKTTLAGAEFQLHKCKPVNEAGKEGELLDPKADPLTVNGANKWTTDAEGKFTITGIQLEDWFDGKAQTDNFDYCLVETKAPEGYELLPKPVLVPVNSNTPESNATPFTLTSNIGNVKTTTGTFKLPSTGEWGRWWLVGLGVLAILAAAGVITANNRRNTSA